MEGEAMKIGLAVNENKIKKHGNVQLGDQKRCV